VKWKKIQRWKKKRVRTRLRQKETDRRVPRKEKRIKSITKKHNRNPKAESEEGLNTKTARKVKQNETSKSKKNVDEVEIVSSKNMKKEEVNLANAPAKSTRNKS